jgi:hypothetical protein
VKQAAWTMIRSDDAGGMYPAIGGAVLLVRPDRNCPPRPSLGQLHQPSLRSGVLGRFFPVRVNQDVGVDGDQRPGSMRS